MMSLRHGQIDALSRNIIILEILSVIIPIVRTATAYRYNFITEQSDAVIGKDKTAAQFSVAGPAVRIFYVIDDGDPGCDIAVFHRISSIFPFI